MSLFLGLASLIASTALAAPLNQANIVLQRDVPMSRALPLSHAGTQLTRGREVPIAQALLSGAAIPEVRGPDEPVPQVSVFPRASTTALDPRDVPVPPPLSFTDGGHRTLQNLDTPTPPPTSLPENGVQNDYKRDLPAPHPQPTIHKKQSPENPPFIPPPPAIEIGGVHTMSPIGIPVGRGVEERDAQKHAPLPSPRKIPSEKGTPTPPSPVIPVNGAGERNQNQPALPTETAFIPPPPVFEIGGEHTMEPVGRPVGKRQGSVPTGVPHPTFTTIYASPDGQPIPITEQRQLVTNYVPTTSCPPAPLATGSQALDDISIAPSSCTTSLRAIITAICATTLTPLAAPPIPITDCSQYVTCSSQYGYTVLPEATPTASAEGLPRRVQPVQTLTTYHAALWTDVVPGATPTAGIEVVCGAGSECVTETINPVDTPTPTPTPSPTAAATDGEVFQGSGDSTPTPTPTAAVTDGEELQGDEGPGGLLRRLFSFLI